jgi:hypothetical protein
MTADDKSPKVGDRIYDAGTEKWYEWVPGGGWSDVTKFIVPAPPLRGKDT